VYDFQFSPEKRWVFQLNVIPAKTENRTPDPCVTFLPFLECGGSTPLWVQPARLIARRACFCEETKAVSSHRTPKSRQSALMSVYS
jgi:hypothetical protein